MVDLPVDQMPLNEEHRLEAQTTRRQRPRVRTATFSAGFQNRRALKGEEKPEPELINAAARVKQSRGDGRLLPSEA